MILGESAPDQGIEGQDSHDTVEDIFYDLVDARYPNLYEKARQEAVAKMTSMVLDLAAEYHAKNPKD